VDLDPVEAGLAGAGRRLAEGAHDAVEVLRRRALGREAVQRVALPRRAQPGGELDAADVALPAAVRQLEDVLRAVLVHLLAELAPERDLVVAVDRGVAGDDEAAAVDPAPRRHDRPNSRAREPHLPVDARLRAGTVVAVEAPGDARAQDAVRELEVPERERLEDQVGRGH
jgi:hypothetical protein